MSKKVAVVTGGTRGIGRSVALTLAEAGYDVVAVYRSDSLSAEKTEKELKAINSGCCTHACDVCSHEDIKGLFRFVLDAYGTVDVVVNNAGGGDLVYWAEATEDTLERELAFNIKSTYFMSQEAAKIMAGKHFGRIINASSIAAVLPDCCLSQYAAAKAGVRALTRAMAAELGPLGITVNAYAPGIVDTDVTHQMIVERGEEQLRHIAVGRFGTPEDIANLVKFLASEEAGYITGQIIGCDGGMFAIQGQQRANERAQEYLSEKK